MISYGQAALVVLVAAAGALYLGARLGIWHLLHCCLCAGKTPHAVGHIHNARCRGLAVKHRVHDDVDWPPGSLS